MRKMCPLSIPHRECLLEENNMIYQMSSTHLVHKVEIILSDHLRVVTEMEQIL